MKKNTLVKILCLVLVCVMILPLAIACKKGGNGDNGGNGGNTPGGADSGKITISYDPGQGILGDDEWEIEIDKGSRKPTHPTPTHDDESMLFDGWYKDEEFTKPIKTAEKYESDTTLYAKWTKQFQCMDGTYNHAWGVYYTKSAPTCTENGKQARDCSICLQPLETDDPNNPATGHDLGQPVEAGFESRQYCENPGCEHFEKKEFVNVTKDALGKDPNSCVKLVKGDAWGSARVVCIVDGAWDQVDSAVMASKGGSHQIVEVTLAVPTQMDRIYMKGRGAGAVWQMKVQYEGDTEAVFHGSGSFLIKEENDKDPAERKIPFVECDSERLVTKVVIELPTPSDGSDYWEEIGFFRLPADE